MIIRGLTKQEKDKEKASFFEEVKTSFKPFDTT